MATIVDLLRRHTDADNDTISIDVVKWSEKWVFFLSDKQGAVKR